MCPHLYIIDICNNIEELRAVDGLDFYLRNFFVIINDGDAWMLPPPLLRALPPALTMPTLRRWTGALLPGRWKRDVCVERDHFVLNDFEHVTQVKISCCSVCLDSLWRFSAAVDMKFRKHIEHTSDGGLLSETSRKHHS